MWCATVRWRQAPLVKRAAVLGLALAIAVSIAALAGGKFIVDQLFHGYAGLLVGLIVRAAGSQRAVST